MVVMRLCYGVTFFFFTGFLDGTRKSSILSCFLIALVFGCLLLAKLARLKQAKDEAGKEIADYRAQVEREFQKKLAAVCIYW